MFCTTNKAKRKLAIWLVLPQTNKQY